MVPQWCKVSQIVPPVPRLKFARLLTVVLYEKGAVVFYFSQLLNFQQLLIHQRAVNYCFHFQCTVEIEHSNLIPSDLRALSTTVQECGCLAGPHICYEYEAIESAGDIAVVNIETISHDLQPAVLI